MARAGTSDGVMAIRTGRRTLDSLTTEHAGSLMDIEAQKRAASARALEFVRPGMRLGLGSGSTARHFVELLGERVGAGLDVVAVPTSEAPRIDAERTGTRLS